MNKTTWEILGPGGGGALYYPTVSPHDKNVVLTSCDMTCSFMTADGGESWTELNFRGRALCFAHDPARPGVMYAGSTGLFRTEDGGRLWKLLFPDPNAVLTRTFAGDHAEEVVETSDNWPGGQVAAVAIDPCDGDSLVIGVLNGGLALYRSQDGCKTWQPIGRMAGGEPCRIYLDGSGVLASTGAEIARFGGVGHEKQTLPLPGGREILDLSRGVVKETGAAVLYAVTGSRWEGGAFRPGLYRSEDGGKSWTELAGGLDQDSFPGEDRAINRVATCPTDPSVVYASVKEPYHTNTKYFGILKSADGGERWDWALRMDDGQPANRTLGWVEGDYGTDWAGAPFWMGVAPGDPELCYVTDWGTVYKTADGGKLWQQLYTNLRPDGSWKSRGIDVTNVYEPAFDPFDRNRFLLPCTDIGLMASADGGQGWRHAQAGIPDEWVNTCYHTLFDPDVRGRAWSAWANCHDLPRQKMLRRSLENYSGGVCKTEDGAAVWTVSSTGMPKSCLVTHMALDPASKPGSRTLWVAAFGKGVYKSTDDGATWALKNDGIGENLNAWRFCQLPGGGLLLMVAGSTEGGVARDGALYLSLDCAEHWRSLPLPEGVFFANDADWDRENPQRLYLACWGNENGYPARHGGLYATEDGGQSWKALLDTSLHVYGITVIPGAPQALYAAAYEGVVLRSLDGGGSWRALDGIDFKWPKKVQADPNDPSLIYVSTFGSCLWHGPAEGCAKEFGRVEPPLYPNPNPLAQT